MEENIVKTPKFPLGRISVTKRARERLTSKELTRAVSRHASGNWGEVDVLQSIANDKGIATGECLISQYSGNSRVHFWVITEADRSATTILLPEDC